MSESDEEDHKRQILNVCARVLTDGADIPGYVINDLPGLESGLAESIERQFAECLASAVCVVDRFAISLDWEDALAFGLDEAFKDRAIQAILPSFKSADLERLREKRRALLERVNEDADDEPADFAELIFGAGEEDEDDEDDREGMDQCMPAADGDVVQSTIEDVATILLIAAETLRDGWINAASGDPEFDVVDQQGGLAAAAALKTWVKNFKAHMIEQGHSPFSLPDIENIPGIPVTSNAAAKRVSATLPYANRLSLVFPPGTLTPVFEKAAYQPAQIGKINAHRQAVDIYGWLVREAMEDPLIVFRHMKRIGLDEQGRIFSLMQKAMRNFLFMLDAFGQSLHVEEVLCDRLGDVIVADAVALHGDELHLRVTEMHEAGRMTEEPLVQLDAAERLACEMLWRHDAAREFPPHYEKLSSMPALYTPDLPLTDLQSIGSHVELLASCLVNSILIRAGREDMGASERCVRIAMHSLNEWVAAIGSRVIEAATMDSPPFDPREFPKIAPAWHVPRL